MPAEGGIKVLGLLLTICRYLLLILLYVFVFQLARMMFKGYREEQVATAAGVHSQGQLAGKKQSESHHQPREYVEPNLTPLPGAEAGLVVLSSPDKDLPEGTVFPLLHEVVLGRSHDNEVSIPDPFASGAHARIYKNKGQFWLEDLESSNGTYLNEHQVTKPTVLADGDTVRIGGVILKYVRWTYEVDASH